MQAAVSYARTVNACYFLRSPREKELDGRLSVRRRAVSTSAMGRLPITRSIAASRIVARLSVATTESVNNPDCCPAELTL